jgi:hypothetical protein
MSKIVITISTGNDAFQDGNMENEVSRILYDLAERSIATRAIMDINGNKVGNMVVED